MSYDEFNELCRKLWEKDYIYLCIDRSKKRHQGSYCIFDENKNTHIECTSELEAF